jgi:hypothetical protein
MGGGGCRWSRSRSSSSDSTGQCDELTRLASKVEIAGTELARGEWRLGENDISESRRSGTPRPIVTPTWRVVGLLRRSILVFQNECRICGSLWSYIRAVGMRASLHYAHHPLMLRRVGVMRGGLEQGMSSRICFHVAIIFLGTLGALGFSANISGAAVECITEPKYDPPEGSHWYYHIDRTTDRKCWSLMALAPETAPATAARSQRTSARSTLSQTGQRTKPPLSESEQAALYLEFLRWKAQQTTMQ